MWWNKKPKTITNVNNEKAAIPENRFMDLCDKTCKRPERIWWNYHQERFVVCPDCWEILRANMRRRFIEDAEV